MMNYVYAKVTTNQSFYGKTNPAGLIEKYGSPLYVYNEVILRERCRELKNLVNYKYFHVNYSPKANSNLEILKIVRDEGLWTDAMSPGEIYVNLKAGFKPEQVFYISNNVNDEEYLYAIRAGVKISVDSVSQLERYGRLNPGSGVAIRINPGIGAGHHKKVVTGGKKTKFGIEIGFLDEVKKVLQKYNLKITGINQHIGSLFMDGDSYIESVESILSVAKEFADLEFVDLGGGFGIPYHKQENESRLDLHLMGLKLTEIISDWIRNYGKEVIFKIEPGRYITAESAVLLGTVNAVKMNYNIKYIGTDIGFNVLVRPVMYDSHHDIEIYRKSDKPSVKKEQVRIVGNICETGDIIAKDRMLPEIFEEDIIGVLDAGAYGYAMSSNYNNRLRPAEVLIDQDGNDRLIRRRETLEDLLRTFEI
jgi:diaminopimelate decarboxylase